MQVVYIKCLFVCVLYVSCMCSASITHIRRSPEKAFEGLQEAGPPEAHHTKQSKGKARQGYGEGQQGQQGQRQGNGQKQKQGADQGMRVQELHDSHAVVFSIDLGTLGISCNHEKKVAFMH